MRHLDELPVSQELGPLPEGLTLDEWKAYTQTRLATLWEIVLTQAEAKAARAGYRLHPEDQAFLRDYLPTRPERMPSGLGEVAHELGLIEALEQCNARSA